MEFYEKRPVFQAAQFDGTTDSVRRMQDVADFASYRIEGGTRESTITFHVGGASNLHLNRFDWLVKFPNGEFAVMTQREFRERFEKVPSAPVKFDMNISAPKKQWAVA